MLLNPNDIIECSLQSAAHCLCWCTRHQNYSNTVDQYMRNAFKYIHTYRHGETPAGAAGTPGTAGQQHFVTFVTSNSNILF